REGTRSWRPRRPVPRLAPGGQHVRVAHRDPNGQPARTTSPARPRTAFWSSRPCRRWRFRRPPGLGDRLSRWRGLGSCPWCALRLTGSFTSSLTCNSAAIALTLGIGEEVSEAQVEGGSDLLEDLQ